MSRILDTTERLRTLSGRYAAGVDRRDRELFLSAFHPDATLTIVSAVPASKPAVLRGHADLGRVVERIATYDKTFHFVGQSLIDVDDTTARGEVYCIAHHWRTKTDGPAEYMVMFIRYRDEYRRGSDGEWRIAARTVHIDSETRDGRQQ